LMASLSTMTVTRQGAYRLPKRRMMRVLTCWLVSVECATECVLTLSLVGSCACHVVYSCVRLCAPDQDVCVLAFSRSTDGSYPADPLGGEELPATNT
jgi:hypothetical protein